ncbi:ATP-binding protein [Pseudomonas sp. D47]|uniref:ATP-binding protein n=1 Tax=Pseudomonas sp. D47 TaxID=3159447 RepID=UPI00387B7D3C
MNLSLKCFTWFFLPISGWVLGVVPAVAADEVRLLVRTPTHSIPVSFAPHTRAWLDRAPAVRVAIWGGSRPPMYMGYDTGVFEGLTADVLGTLQPMLGLQFKILRYKNRVEALEAIARDEVDMLAFNDATVAPNLLVNATTPYLLNRKILLRRSSDRDKSTTNLANERLAYIGPNEALASRLRQRYPGATLISYTNHLTALTALTYNQVDAMRSGAITAEYLTSRFYRDDVYVADDADVSPQADIDFAVSAWRPQLLDALNRSLAAILLADMQRLTSSWGLSDDCVLARQSLALTLEQKAWIAAHPNPKLIVAGANVPLSFYDEKGQLRGLSIELLKLIERYTGLKFQIERSDSVSDMVNQLQNHQVDVLATLIIGDHWIEPRQFTRPYIISPFVVVTRRSETGIHGLEGLNGMRLALTQGNPLSEWVTQHYPKIKIVPVDNATRGLEMLAEGKVDGAVHTWFGADYFVTQHFRSDLHIASVFGPSYARVAMAVAPDNLILKDILDVALLQISPQALKGLTDRWRSNTPPAAASSWSTYHDLVYQIIGVALLFGLVFLIWIYYLRRQIQKRRKAERDLENQLEFSRTLIDGAPLALYVRDQEARLVHCNQAYLDFVKKSREELIGKTLIESSHSTPEFSSSHHHIYMDVLKQGQPRLNDVDVEMFGQHHRLYHWILPYRDTAGAALGLIGGWLDISEREHLVTQLEIAKEEAVQASRSKSAFLASMSHEIRTPISALIGLIELLRLQQASPEQMEESLEVAHQSAQSLLSLIGDILDLSKIEAGAMVASPRPTHLSQLIESVHRLFEPNALKKRLDYRLVMDVLHPGVMIDPLMLNQIVANLISNAVKFTEQGSVYVLLRELPEPPVEGRYAYEIQIGDTGTGLSEVEQQEIFEPFVQAGPHADQKGGTGLGLSICNSLVQVLGMALSVESQKGVGSRFTLRFDAEPAEALHNHVDGALTAGNSFHRLKILVAEDHAPNRLLLCQQIEYLGHEAVPCNDGEAALRLWSDAKPPFDLTITDCNMPHMDGYELTSRMRDQECDLAASPHPIFGLTANAQNEIVDRCMAAGMTRCLFKPLGVETLSPLLAEIALQAERRSSAARAGSELEKLRALNPDAYGPLVEQLLCTNKEDGKKLVAALRQGHHEGMVRLVHRIRGSAQLANHQCLVEACRTLEESSSATPVEDQRRLVGEILQFLDALETKLLLDSSPGPC